MVVKSRESPDDFVVALLFVVFALLALLVPPQPDTWFHLRAGREIWEDKAPILYERFSYTSAGRPWDNHEWLYQVLFYGAFSVGGPFGLVLLTGGCAFAAVAVSWRMMRARYELRLFLLLALLVLITPSWGVRPQAISLLVFLLAIHLGGTRRPVWMPLLIVVWANAHGAVLLGVIVAAISAFDALVWSPERRRYAIPVAVACLVAPSLSPLGWQYWPRVAQTVSEARLVGIHEYRSAFELAALPFWGLFSALIVSALRRWREFGALGSADRQLVLVALVLGVAAVMSVRNIAFFALVACPALCILVSRRMTPETAKALRAPVLPVVLAGVLAAGVGLYRWRDSGAHLGWRPMSEPAVQAVRRCPGPIFNTYGAGGILLWFVPEKPVFVDGRLEAYPLELIERSRYVDLSGDYEQLFEDFGIRCAIVPTESPVADALRRSQWQAVRYTDPQWTVFGGTSS